MVQWGVQTPAQGKWMEAGAEAEVVTPGGPELRQRLLPFLLPFPLSTKFIPVSLVSLQVLGEGVRVYIGRVSIPIDATYNASYLSVCP